MAIYLGNQKQKLRIGQTSSNFIVGTFGAVETNKLLTREGFVLIDANGDYLIPREDD